jgi:hypothetical protein
LRRPRYALLTGSAVAITCFFSASYINADISRYYLGPALIAWTWLAILAGVVVDLLAAAMGEGPLDDVDEVDQAHEADPAVTDPGGQAGRPAMTRTWGGVIALVLAVVLLVPTVIDAPARYRAVDASRQRDAATWTDHVLGALAPGAVIVSWWSYSTPLWYAQRVQGRRPDVTIIDDRTRLDENLGGLTEVIDANLGSRPVYVLRLDDREVKLLAERYELDFIDGTNASSLTRVVGPKAAS